VPRPVAIVGAGIGGLTAVLALSRHGRPTVVLERRTALDETGAGLQLSPNASRVLIDLGLGPALRRVATEPPCVRIRRAASGVEIGIVALGAALRERFGAPYWVLARADLHRILLDAVRGRPDVRLLVGRSVASVADGAAAVKVTIEKAGGRETLEADAVVGADGLWSAVRRALGDERAPSYRGAVAWRATVPRTDVPGDLAGSETGLWLGRGGHVVHYPIAGGQAVNVVAIHGRAEPVEGWSAPGDPSELLAAFGPLAPSLSRLLEAPATWRLWSLHDLPVKAMASGRTALLGDAAHPVLPTLAQGAALAIEDAACLAQALSDDAPAAPALARYAASRVKRVRKVQREARRNRRVYHLPWPASLARDLAIRRLGPERMSERYAWLYGWKLDRS
jgi:salicylate hydroxylase